MCISLAMALVELPCDVLCVMFDMLGYRDMATLASTCTALLRAPCPMECVLMRRAVRWSHGIGSVHGSASGHRTLFLARLGYIRSQMRGTLSVGLKTGFYCADGVVVECAVGKMAVVPMLTACVMVCGIATGFGFSVAVCANGCVYSWGESRDRGVLGHGGDGDGDGNGDVFLPRRILALEGHRIANVYAGPNHCMGVDDGGDVWSWGLNACGQCGQCMSVRAVYVPMVMKLPGHVRICAGSCGFDHSALVSREGTVWFVGRHCVGDEACDVPTLMDGLNDQFVIAVSSGLYHSLAMSLDGSVFAWGSNASGELGRDDVFASRVPGRVGGGLRGVHYISAGARRSCGVTGGGGMWMWGSGYGPHPVRVCDGVVAVSVGATRTMAVSSGKVVEWEN